MHLVYQMVTETHAEYASSRAFGLISNVQILTTEVKMLIDFRANIVLEFDFKKQFNQICAKTL